MRTLESCLVIEHDTIHGRSENGKRFELRNDVAFECRIYDVDKCLFAKESIKRCDWLFVVPKNEEKNTILNLPQQRAYYIELKGGDHSTACKQLYNSIDKTKASFPNFEFHARIISNIGLHPKLTTNEYYKKVKRLIGRDIIVGKVHKGNQLRHSEQLT